MTKAIRTAIWTRADGKGMIEMTVTASRGYETVTERVNLDGDVSEITKREVIESTKIILKAGGKDYDCVDVTARELRARASQLAAGTTMVLLSGNTYIGITGENEPKVKASIAEATAEAETDPEWAEILAKRAESRAYDEHARKVERMMTLDGHTY